MTSRDFCYWLQGFFEIASTNELLELDSKKVQTIKNHLALVFKHEIDPSIDKGDKNLINDLQKIHDGLTKGATATSVPMNEVLIRC